jgi:hypothetical protein
MGRIRTSKPEWWKSAKWCRLSRDVRSTYKGIWEVMCDDEGRFLADPRQVKADVWPLDDDITPKKLAAWLPKLADVMVTTPDGVKSPAVIFYEVDGVRYGFLPGFVKHQKISHPTPSKLPKPPSIYKEDIGSDSGEFPESLANDSGAAPENLRPDKDRIGLGEGLGLGLGSGEEASPRVVLPHEAEQFLDLFYEPALSEPQRKRYRDVKRQLYDVIDPKHPGPKIRGGTRVKARSTEHLIDELNAVMKDPPPDRDLAIVWLLKRLTNPAKGPTVTERMKREEEKRTAIEERYFREARRAGIRWASQNRPGYEAIVGEIEERYRGQNNAFAHQAKESERIQKCAQAAGFPSFEEWLEKQAVPA